jgi:hypothetical protein
MQSVVKSGIMRLVRRAGYGVVASRAAPIALVAPPVLPPDAADQAPTPKPPLYTVFSEWDLVRMLPARFPLRVFVNGFPGAGNVILQYVSDELLRSAGPARPKPADDYETPLIAFLGPRYDRFREMLIACCPPGWRDNCHFNVHRGGQLVDFVSSPSFEHFLYGGPFVVGAHFNTNQHASHELPSRANYELYAGYGYRILPIVRHPLDILVSLAGKSPLSLDEEETIGSTADPAERRRLEQAARGRAAQARLNDDCWLRLAAAALTRFFAEQAKLQLTWPALRFENVLGDPAGFVALLAQRLGLDVSVRRVGEIASAIGAKQLAPGHFGQPSCGKWRKAFTPDRLHFLESFGLFETAEELGYPRPKAAELVGASSAETSAATPQELSNRLRLLQFQYFAQTFDPDWVIAASGLDDVKFARVGGVRLFGSDQSVLDLFCEKLARTALDALRQSA